MSLASNLTGQISSLMFGGGIQNIINDVDLNDQTFSNILNDKIGGINNQINSAGIDISEFHNINTNNIQKTDRIDTNKIQDMTTSEVVTFTKSLFDESNNVHNPIYSFSRKSATDFYNKYSKSIAMNLEEFVADTIRK